MTVLESAITSRYKFAELTSGVGALVLGVGIGISIAEHARPMLVPLLLSGAGTHAWGMYELHRLQRSVGSSVPRWSVVLYWVCWVSLLVAGGIVIRSMV